MTTKDLQSVEAIPNTNAITDTLATVSLRNMPRGTWKAARHRALEKGITLTQYIKELIENTSNPS
jgi:hypothetical protein